MIISQRKSHHKETTYDKEQKILDTKTLQALTGKCHYNENYIWLGVKFTWFWNHERLLKVKALLYRRWETLQCCIQTHGKCGRSTVSLSHCGCPERETGRITLGIAKAILLETCVPCLRSVFRELFLKGKWLLKMGILLIILNISCCHTMNKLLKYDTLSKWKFCEKCRINLFFRNGYVRLVPGLHGSCLTEIVPTWLDEDWFAGNGPSLGAVAILHNFY